MMSFIGLRRARAISRPGSIMKFWGSGSGLRESRVPAGFRSARSINSQLAILSWIFFGMAGRPLPIHTFFSFATEPDFGRSRLSHAVADSDAVVVASAEDTAVVPDALPVLAESGRFAVGGIAPNLMGAVEASGRGRGRKRGGGTRERV